jgi:hypothetical protein
MLAPYGILILEDIIPLNIEEIDIEVLARITKRTCQNAGCNLDIKFRNGNRQVQSVGEEQYRSYIAQGVCEMLRPTSAD